MIRLHHLETSRSTRILWLLEELGIDHELVRYERTPERRAPPALKVVHPLGKSPTLEDGALVLAESSAILRYLDDRYGDGRFSPPAGSDAHARHDEWLDMVEGSVAMPVLTALRARLGGVDAATAAMNRPVLAAMLGYIETGIGDGPFVMGAQLTLADIQFSYLLEIAAGIGLLDDHPGLTAYLDRLRRQPGLLRAIEKGGPMMLRLD